MNGFLGEEGTFGYLAQSAGGVRKQAKYMKAANPVRSFLRAVQDANSCSGNLT